MPQEKNACGRCGLPKTFALDSEGKKHYYCSIHDMKSDPSQEPERCDEGCEKLIESLKKAGAESIKHEHLAPSPTSGEGWPKVEAIDHTHEYLRKLAAQAVRGNWFPLRADGEGEVIDRIESHIVRLLLAQAEEWKSKIGEAVGDFVTNLKEVIREYPYDLKREDMIGLIVGTLATFKKNL